MQNENPYESPTEECVVVEPVFRVEPAEAWRRFVNVFLDNFGQMFLSFAISFAVAFVAKKAGVKHTIIEQIPEFLIGFVAYLIYYIPQEALLGKTLGKFVTGTRVVSAAGTKPTLLQIVGRTFSRMIPFDAFSFLFAGGNYPVGWHDSLSKTRVILDR